MNPGAIVRPSTSITRMAGSAASIITWRRVEMAERESKGYWHRRVSRRRALAVGATTSAGLAVVTAVGCGDDDTDAPSSPVGSAAAGAQQPPKRGGTLRITFAV